MKYEQFLTAKQSLGQVQQMLGVHYPTYAFSDEVSVIGSALNNIRAKYLHLISIQVEDAIMKAKPMFADKKERRDFEVNVHAHGDIYTDKNLRRLFCKKVASEISDVDGVPHSLFAERRDLAPMITEFIIGINLSNPD